MRAAAMLGVVCIHASSWGRPDPYIEVNTLSRFAVPAFVVLTGLLLAYQYHRRALGGDFMRRRVARSIVPWLAWVPVYIAFDILIGTVKPTSAGVLSFLQLGTGHLWFLLLVPQLYLLFALGVRHASWRFAAVAVALQVALYVVRLYVTLPGSLSGLVLSHGYLIFPFWIGYFAVGVAAGRHLARIRLHRPPPLPRTALAAGAAVLVVASAELLLNAHYPGARYAGTFLRGTGAFLNPLLPLFVFASVWWLHITMPLVMQHSSAMRSTVRVLSDQSLGLYIVHPMLLWYFGGLLVHAVGARSPLTIPAFTALVLLTLLSSMIVVRLIAATPLAVTLGVPRTPLAFASRANAPPARMQAARR